MIMILQNFINYLKYIWTSCPTDFFPRILLINLELKMGSSQNSYRDLILDLWFRFKVWSITIDLIKTYGEWCGNFFSKMELYELWGVDVKRYDGMNCGGRYELWLGLLKVKFFIERKP